jgi:hypothetical protein
VLRQDPHFKVALIERWDILLRSGPAPSYSLEGITEIIFQSAMNETHWADALKPGMGDPKLLFQGNNAVKTLTLRKINNSIKIPRPTRESLLQFINFMVNEIQESWPRKITAPLHRTVLDQVPQPLIRFHVISQLQNLQVRQGSYPVAPSVSTQGFIQAIVLLLQEDQAIALPAQCTDRDLLNGFSALLQSKTFIQSCNEAMGNATLHIENGRITVQTTTLDLPSSSKASAFAEAL